MAVRLLLVAIMAAFTFGALALYVNSTEANDPAKFIVNSSLDGGDANPGDAVCDTVAGPPVICTLRAAIQESNALNGANVINFTATNTVLGAELPPITERLTIDASDNADGFSIDALAAGAGNDGLILGTGSSGSVIRGLNLFGAPNDNLVICGGASHTIGGDPDEGAAPTGQGNAFHGAVAGDGIDIQTTGSNALCDAAGSLGGHFIIGNRIGTSPDGQTALAANQNAGEGINVSGGVGADITIGGFPNLISNNLLNGINVNGGSADLIIQNNWIGLDANGSASDPFANGDDGIFVTGTGHPAMIQNNVLGGGGVGAFGNPSENGIVLTAGADDNTVVGNCIGSDSTCAGSSGGFNNTLLDIDTDDNLIGDGTEDGRNVLNNASNSIGGGAVVGDASHLDIDGDGNIVDDNFLGFGDDGETDGTSEFDCVAVDGDGNELRNNVIGNCLGRGIRVGADPGGGTTAGNIIEDNDLGRGTTPASADPIDQYCIELVGTTAVEGSNQVLGNTMANCGTGVVAVGGSDASVQILSGNFNLVSGNDITSPVGEDAVDVEAGTSNTIASHIFRMVNQGTGDLPIDLIGGTAAEGVDVNDAGDADTCANTNCEHNYPVFPPSSATDGCARGSAGPFDAVRVYSKSEDGNVTTYEYLATGSANVAGDFTVCFDSTSKLTVVGTATTTAGSTLDGAAIGSTSEFSVTEQTVQAGSTPTMTVTATPTLGTPTVTPTPEPATDTPVPPTATSVPPTATDEPDPQVCGDVNLDGDVNSVDASLILQFKVELISTLDNEDNADVDDNGEISSVDAALILQATAGLFPVGDLDCPPKS